MNFYDSRNLFAQSTWTLLKIYKFDKSEATAEYTLLSLLFGIEKVSVLRS